MRYDDLEDLFSKTIGLLLMVVAIVCLSGALLGGVVWFVQAVWR
jgi:hypothetical protein